MAALMCVVCFSKLTKACGRSLAENKGRRIFGELSELEDLCRPSNIAVYLS